MEPEIAAQQAALYGAPADEVLASITTHMGLDLGEVARCIGVSLPMLSRVREGARVRIGNPVAIARLAMLTEFAGHLASGVADPDDIPLTVAQISVATGPGGANGPTAVASRPSGVPADGPPPLLTHPGLREARERVRRHVAPSPAIRWPLLERFTGTETWVKHENHNPTGAFKVRGGLNLVARMVASERPAGLVSASRGNHAQSLAYAGAAHGVPVVIVVPEGNSPDKNQATEAYGGEVLVHGRDFQEAAEHAVVVAEERGWTMVPSYHPWLVEGVATYAAELHEDVPGLDVIYVPVGMGSGACANIAVRDLLGARTEIVAVVSENAPAYALAFQSGTVVTTPTADTFVDGVACRTPHPDAVAILHRGAARFVRVSEAQAAEAMALAYRCTHNLAEPAGSLALAGLLAERSQVAGKRVAVVHTGGNADYDVLARAMG